MLVSIFYSDLGCIKFYSDTQTYISHKRKYMQGVLQWLSDRVITATFTGVEGFTVALKKLLHKIRLHIIDLKGGHKTSFAFWGIA